MQRQNPGGAQNESTVVPDGAQARAAAWACAWVCAFNGPQS